MNSPSSAKATVSTGIREEYEKLRANALGQLNRPCGLLLFMQRGMSSWLRTLAGLSNSDLLPHCPTADSTRGTSTNALVGIMADAILEIIGPIYGGKA